MEDKMGRIGFDNDKYLKMQSEHIEKRINDFGGKLYSFGTDAVLLAHFAKAKNNDKMIKTAQMRFYTICGIC